MILNQNTGKQIDMYVKQKLRVSLADAVILILCERVTTKIHVTENYIG